MRFLTVFLILLSTLARAANGDFIRATINGKVYEVKGDEPAIHYQPGGSEFATNQAYTLTISDPAAHSRLVLALYVPVGATLKTGAWSLPVRFGLLTAEAPYAYLHLDEVRLPDPISWVMEDAADGSVIITAVKGKVVEGTFRAKLRASDRSVREVKNGTFRFTME